MPKLIDSAFARYLLQKILWYVLAFFVAVALNFFLPRLIPGNPVAVIVSQMAQQGVQSAALERLYATLHGRVWPRPAGPRPVHPVLGRGFPAATSAPRLCFTPARCLMSIRSALPWTLALQIPAILVGWTLGNVLGAVAAYKRGVFDRTIFTTGPRPFPDPLLLPRHHLGLPLGGHVARLSRSGRL